jgi:hypothetical protein
MDQIDKINKINAYRKLLESRKLPKVDPESADSVSIQEINLEFDAWVMGQISELLGETKAKSSPTLPFTEDEISILRSLIEGVKLRQAPRQAAPARPQQPRQLERAPEHMDAPPVLNRPRAPRESRDNVPLVQNRPRTQGRTPAADTGEDLASALEQMEDQGPNFD